MEGIMIQTQSIYLKITKIDGTTFKIFSGPTTDFKDQSILIGSSNPTLLWNLLHSLIGLPIPELLDPKKIIKEYLEQKAIKKSSEPPPEKLPQSDIEKELSALSASEIVAKVFNEKGIQITNNLKSKAAILRKALKIYENKLDLSV
jgi:hypothetical protein